MSMDDGILFITAKDLTFQQLNELTVQIRGWQDPDDPYVRLVVTKADFPDCLDPSGGFSTPIDKELVTGNAWAGASINEVEQYMHAQMLKDKRNASECFVVIDDEGMSSGTAVVTAGKQTALGKTHDLLEAGAILFAKVRVLWPDVYTVWCNIDTGNAGPEDFAASSDCDDQGWFVPNDEELGLGNEDEEEPGRMLEEIRALE